MVLSIWKQDSFLRLNKRWCAFLHTASQFISKDNLESITVPRYLSHSTKSKAWFLMIVVSWVEGCVLKSMIISFVLNMFSSKKYSLYHVTNWSINGPWLDSLLCSTLTITESSANFKKVLLSCLLWHILCIGHKVGVREHSPEVTWLKNMKNLIACHSLSLSVFCLSENQ